MAETHRGSMSEANSTRPAEPDAPAMVLYQSVISDSQNYANK